MISTNEYFDGQVKSLGYTTSIGNSTIGVMEPGTYEFGTSTHETMHIIEGEMSVKLPGSTAWLTFKAGTSYEIDADEKFQVKVSAHTAYLCQYK
ncbi:pyrimidine/purine nucleoside phosphorylase [Algibacter mikhailovii]|uniref:pyrimidine/purine nucleoside phosphorylase n=1 Tax=Algibacter mikhailovii TaxID=425498 RepID=UPI0024955626|nr:pyrimidine/purine nucleoside phosphorylase [Algibacter mikhailovii]